MNADRVELPGARVLFSTRRGGVSEGPYASLNLGRLTDDDGANVDANRDRLAAAVGLPRDRFLYCKQVHDGRGEYELSPEEDEAIRLALSEGATRTVTLD